MSKYFYTLLLLMVACASSGFENANDKAVELGTESSFLTCGQDGVYLQILGSGGPEIDDGRASTSYLIWNNGKAKVLVDTGPGSALNFEKSGAKFEDLEMILYSHFHVDHVADLATYIKASFFGPRTSDLLIIGPPGNKIMPGTEEIVQRMFAHNTGAFQYLGDYLPNESKRSENYQINAKDYSESIISPDNKIKAKAARVRHGPNPALAWRIDIAQKSILFSGDMGFGGPDFVKLLNTVDLFVAHNAIPESFSGGILNLHMPPSLIGQYADEADVKKLLISHRMQRTLGNENETESFIRKSFKGDMQFANDLNCFKL